MHVLQDCVYLQAKNLNYHCSQWRSSKYNQYSLQSYLCHCKTRHWHFGWLVPRHDSCADKGLNSFDHRYWFSVLWDGKVYPSWPATVAPLRHL